MLQLSSAILRWRRPVLLRTSCAAQFGQLQHFRSKIGPAYRQNFLQRTCLVCMQLTSIIKTNYCSHFQSNRTRNKRAACRSCSYTNISFESKQGNKLTVSDLQGPNKWTLALSPSADLNEQTINSGLSPPPAAGGTTERAAVAPCEVLYCRRRARHDTAAAETRPPATVSGLVSDIVGAEPGHRSAANREL